MARFNPERSQIMMGGQLFVGTQNPIMAASIAGSGIAADKALGAIQRSAAQDAISRILSGYSPPKPESMWWRAPMEARPRMAEEEQR